MAVIYELEPGQVLGPDDVDGMAFDLAEEEAAGWESEYTWDASCENPPHPFIDPKTGQCIPDWKPGPDWKHGKK